MVCEHLSGDTLALADEPEQEVLGADRGMAQTPGFLVCEMQRLFGAGAKSICDRTMGERRTHQCSVSELHVDNLRLRRRAGGSMPGSLVLGDVKIRQAWISRPRTNPVEHSGLAVRSATQ